MPTLFPRSLPFLLLGVLVLSACPPPRSPDDDDTGGEASDTDGDGVPDLDDCSPTDPTQWSDSDGDGYMNKCENKWNTHPKDPTSFPSQGELCDMFN